MTKTTPSPTFHLTFYPFPRQAAGLLAIPHGGEVHGPAFVARGWIQSQFEPRGRPSVRQSHRNPGPSKRTTRRIMPGSSGMQASGAAGKAHSLAVPPRSVLSSDSEKLTHASSLVFFFNFDLDAIL
jgi:hypothetical protein